VEFPVALSPFLWYNGGKGADNMVSLRPILQSDLERMLDILTNEKVNKTYMLPDFKQRQDAAPLFERLMNMSQGQEKFVRAIDLEGGLIGFMNQVEVQNGTIELGYVIHPDFHNRGYMTRALKAAIEELFARNYQRVICGAFEGNKASQRVMEKAGMKKIEFKEIIEYRGVNHTCVYFEVRKEH
jgi:RimJ/RimL family protein N-acetyltransferase